MDAVEENVDFQQLHVEQACIPSDLTAIQPVRERFISFLLSLGVNDKEKQGWKLVFTEITNNAILHGGGGDVKIDWYVSKYKINLIVNDTGNGPELSRLENPELPEDPISESGRGLFIISEFADRVYWSSGSDGFSIRIEKTYARLNSLLPASPELDPILDELSGAYESLASFHSLAKNLIHSYEISSFFDGALNDFSEIHEFSKISIVPSINIKRTLFSQLEHSNFYQSDESLPEILSALAMTQKEYVWDQNDRVGTSEIDVRVYDFAEQGCIIPISHDEHCYGVIIALRANGIEAIKSHSIESLRTLGEIFGIACANMRLRLERDKSQQYERELQIAVGIQRSLLPIIQPLDSIFYEASIKQISSLDVAGDYCETRHDESGNLVVAIIDVMGKGVSAALLASIFRSAFDLVHNYTHLDEMLEAINDVLCRQLGEMTMFVTCTVLRFNSNCAFLEQVNAGHCRTLIFPARDDLLEIEPSGPPLGLSCGVKYETERFNIEKGCEIFLVSDGCYEWRKNNEMFGWAAMTDFFNRKRCDGIENLWNALISEIQHGDTANQFSDDLTLFHLKVIK
ncbi:ATP-binding SpoIIE family protein phosphatase [Rubellicoccus peritrichatus]|uniref:ATP-binding SpoIIE family protein phosphatase n=1 Tax=Rubellicoccus peritrichatus TaxID=3080537 RepID=A0AAQ3LDQ5_9BACT|nr:ATP-binding SpoIIE family protein phosphatase [Puniceicoccus sp. CR14]WOO42010.1 ATP-binding SpoIIE family protein phosphatase [Puniceicoccus sp. CR14]